jgi:catechol 2,3-dioxygenase
MSAFLPDQTRLSQVHLRTAGLDRALEFYSNVLGLRVLHEEGSRAVVSASKGTPGLIVLTEDQNATPRPRPAAGLDHFAIRCPSRRGLARAYRRLVEKAYPVAGAADHGVSEAIYLADPDGNGIELYADRRPEQWPRRNGHIEMSHKAVNPDQLLPLIANEPTTSDAPTQIEIGHIHFSGVDSSAAERFYGEFLGLAVTQRSNIGALFFAAGGYHHHVGFNRCAGKAALPVNSVGLVSYRLEVPITEILYCLDHRAPLLGYQVRPGPKEAGNPVIQFRDPSGNWLEVQASPEATSGNLEACCPAGSEPASQAVGLLGQNHPG